MVNKVDDMFEVKYIQKGMGSEICFFDYTQKQYNNGRIDYEWLCIYIDPPVSDDIKWKYGYYVEAKRMIDAGITGKVVCKNPEYIEKKSKRCLFSFLCD